MEKNKRVPISNKDYFEKTAVRVSMVSIVGNIILSVFKLLAGFVAHSGAMISDAVHSLSDVFSSIVVIIGVRLSAKEPDNEHPYGHERLECVAAIILSVILFITGLFIGADALEAIFAKSGEVSEPPGILALIAAVVSIVVKEAMFHYTKYYARKLDSGAVMADAWHHRSDALSSIGALIGIAGARMGAPILDPAAGLVICLSIVKAAFDIFKDAVEKMVDRSCDEKTKKEISDCVSGCEGVLKIDLLRTRAFGSKIYVDVEICVDGECSLRAAHSIAEQVHNAIESRYPKVKHVMVHVNPDEEDS